MKNSIQLVLSSSKTIDFFDPMTLCDKQHMGFPLATLSFCSKITFCPVGTCVWHTVFIMHAFTRSPDIRLYASQTYIKKVEVPNE